MKVIKEQVTFNRFVSEIYPNIDTTDSSYSEVIDWADKNPHVYKIVTGTKSKAFGKSSCVYIGWAQNNNSAGAILERLSTFKQELEHANSIFQYRADFTFNRYLDKGFKGGFFQQWDERYPRNCLTLDYTPELLEQVIDRFYQWTDNYFNTVEITIDKKTVRTYNKEK